jgi:hypothetical protein
MAVNEDDFYTSVVSGTRTINQNCSILFTAATIAILANGISSDQISVHYFPINVAPLFDR